MHSKTCQQCGKTKQLTSNFNVGIESRLNPDGYSKTCKACLAINNAIRYQDQKVGRVPRRSFRVDNPA